jgi:diadenosine tetraphosphate (Ap4A) HIT family hydrolase
VADQRATIGEAFRVLSPGGRFLVCNLSPVAIASVDPVSWCRDDADGKRHFALDDYPAEGPRRLVFRSGHEITNFHRMFSTTVIDFLDAGFTLTRVHEPVPTPEQLERYPRERGHAPGPDVHHLRPGQAAELTDPLHRPIARAPVGPRIVVHGQQPPDPPAEPGERWQAAGMSEPTHLGPTGGVVWATPSEWERRRRPEGCVICTSGGPLDVIGESPSIWVTAERTAPLPGYVCVVAKRHVVEPFELTAHEQAEFWLDAMLVARAVAELVRPIKMNYEIHGNTLPHLHLHLLPRQVDDPYVGGPVDPRVSTVERTESQLDGLGTAVRAALT